MLLSPSRLDAVDIEVKSGVGENEGWHRIRHRAEKASCGDGGTLNWVDWTGVEPKIFWGKDKRTLTHRLLLCNCRSLARCRGFAPVDVSLDLHVSIG
jgi:hypothetical protein